MHDPINFTNKDYMYEAAAAILQGKRVTINEGLSLGDVAPYNKLPAINALIKTEVEFLLGKKINVNPVYFDGNDMYSNETNLKIKGNAINGKRTIKDLADIALGELKETKDEMEEVIDTKTIANQVKTLKIGDKTNFGVVKEIGKDSITFKAKDLPVTTIKFNQYKMGSRDLILSKLMKLREDTALNESSSDVDKIAKIIADFDEDQVEDLLVMLEKTFRHMNFNSVFDNEEDFSAIADTLNKVVKIWRKFYK